MARLLPPYTSFAPPLFASTARSSPPVRGEDELPVRGNQSAGTHSIVDMSILNAVFTRQEKLKVEENKGEHSHREGECGGRKRGVAATGWVQDSQILKPTQIPKTTVRATTGGGSVKSGLGRRRILSITIYNKGGRKYLLTWAEGGSLENKLRITCPGVTSFMFPHMTRYVTERRDTGKYPGERSVDSTNEGRDDRGSSGGSGGLGGRRTRLGSEDTDKARVRTGGAEDGGRRSRANARGRLVDSMNEERDDRRSSGGSGGPEAQVRCPEHGALSPRLGSRRTESGRQDARGREGRERMYYAKAIVSGTSLYGSRPHPGGWAYGGSGGSGGPGRTSGAEERMREGERGESGCTMQRPQYLARACTAVGHILEAGRTEVPEVPEVRVLGGPTDGMSGRPEERPEGGMPKDRCPGEVTILERPDVRRIGASGCPEDRSVRTFGGSERPDVRGIGASGCPDRSLDGARWRTQQGTAEA
ncbi:hypothetical protein K438DRAFT_2062899 [Mycena galopus ATCC 62051]|nr:hypothetical protein K438DRAFT_2062899 [Mycena galopus ATCC 62051]